MSDMAARWGGDPSLYRRVGEIHDADYLMFPHDAPGAAESHPVPLVRALQQKGVHPAICLAVLEHAPYIGLDRRPSSRLSAALSAAEDLATLAALDPPFAHLGQLSPEGKALLAGAEPKVRIARRAPLRVEANLDRYVNAPLALVAGRHVFPLAV